MKLFKYALLLIVLIGFVSVASAFSYTMSGTKIGSNFVTGYDVTCTAISSKTGGSYAIFTWTQGSSTKTMNITKNSGKYICTLPASYFNTTGEWHIHFLEYSSTGAAKDNGEPQFNAINNGGPVALSVGSGPYVYGSQVTASATVSGTTPVTFRWYRPGESTPIRIYSVSTSPYTDSFSDANVVGTWRVTATQSVFTSPEATFSVSSPQSSNTFLITGDISPIGSFILTEPITAEVTSVSNDGVKMLFTWYSPTGLVESNTVDKINGKYTYILPAGKSTAAGSWHVDVIEKKADGTQISSATEEFNTAESYSISGTKIGGDLVTGYDVTCSIYSPDIGGSYMIFEWYNGANTLVKTVKIYENNYYFICTLPASDFNAPGQWSIVGTEYTSSNIQMDTTKPLFTAVNNGATISLSGISNTYAYGASVAATATASGTTPVTFSWYRPGESTPIRTYSYSTSSCTDSFSDANVVGTWTVKATQSIYTDTKTFEVSPPQSYAISLNGATSTNGSFVLTENITAIVTSYYTNGVKMNFKWYSPSSSTPVRTSNVTKNDQGKYEDILPGSLFTGSTGLWYVNVYEYTTDQVLITSTPETSSQEFEAEGAPEFPIGSFVPLLLGGAIYIKVRRKMEGS